MSDTAPDDISLTVSGRAPERSGRLLLIACGALAREILALRHANGWHHLDLACLPAILHNTPDAIPDAVEAAVHRHRDAYERIFVVYADCGTGGRLAARCDALGVEMVPGPHCYAFFDGLSAFDTRDEMTAFYLTDFLARQFEAFVIEPLGLDRHPELRDMYFGHYDRVIYLAQTADATLTERARACADRLGLRFERRFTGYGDLATTLDRWAEA
ncbi:hypothetical protein ROJ8625_01120 [Roseivivax jejudonensis]|uniref:DUF1638 domain-containing protein n=1 Tax=Roseivivax jejudonensis TaxID=1529041 RepID=A0A1X6YP67_9RHOB|nr:DUF1638 domain-containing protein [Roseivivax jejudonensis]SLN27329.1 hypothetical protein ROJ8625_01120 [Roseivivax jejudonensis]